MAHRHPKSRPSRKGAGWQAHRGELDLVHFPPRPTTPHSSSFLFPGRGAERLGVKLQSWSASSRPWCPVWASPSAILTKPCFCICETGMLTAPIACAGRRDSGLRGDGAAAAVRAALPELRAALPGIPAQHYSFQSVGFGFTAELAQKNRGTPRF